MGLEESILQAKSFLEGAAGVVDTGLGIFDNVAKTFYPNPVPYIPSSDPAGETGGIEKVTQPAPSILGNGNAGILIVAGIAAYLLLR